MGTGISEAEIIIALKAKQYDYTAAANAYDIIIDRFLVYVIRMIKNITGSEAVSAELAANAFADWFEAVNTTEFNSLVAIRKYIYKSALKSSIVYLTELEKTDGAAYQLLYKSKEEFHRSIVKYSYDALFMEQLHDKIDELPVIQKHAFKLCYLERMSTLDAANRLNLPEIQITQYCRQAIEYFTRCFTHGQFPTDFSGCNSNS